MLTQTVTEPIGALRGTRYAISASPFVLYIELESKRLIFSLVSDGPREVALEPWDRTFVQDATVCKPFEDPDLLLYCMCACCLKVRLGVSVGNIARFANFLRRFDVDMTETRPKCFCQKRVPLRRPWADQ